MAYNLEPLVQFLDQILHPNPHHSWILDPTKKSEIESLLNKALSLRDLFEKSSSLTRNKIESLESRITDATHNVEDILESRLVDQIQSTREGKKFTFSSPDNLEKVSMEFDSIEEEIKMVMNQSHISDFSPSSDVESSRSEPNPKNILVGFNEDLLQLKDRATNRQPKLEIIPIVGMGGMGKTTLARNVYEDPLVTSHFDTRAWIIVSQDYNVRRIIIGLLHCVIGNLTEEMIRLDDEELAVRLYQCLCGRRYMIVLDDMWDSKAWDDVRRFLPNDNNGSRILITTRELNIANYVDSSKNSHHNMHFLNMDDSWDLLRQKVFAQESCPELEGVGREIATNCGGLPLAIHVVGGVLSHAKRSQEFWRQVAKDVSSAVGSEDELFPRILSLSYNHLPVHLRPCFLYMAAFPEDYEVRASRLVLLWIAEGFVKPTAEESSEEAGEMYIKALIDRNLFLVRKQDTNGNVKSCSIHDLLRDLCTKKAHEEKFMFIKNRRQLKNNSALSLRRVSAYSSYHIRGTYNSMKQVRSFLFIGSTYWVIISEVVLKLRLLRVLDILEIEFNQFPKEVLQLFNLRYLALASRTDFSSSITLLCNLQTLYFRRFSNSVYLQGSTELFFMPSLRHIKFEGRYPCYMPHSLTENLRTLCTTSINEWMTFERVPNLTKLGIHFSNRCNSYYKDLTCLHQLQTLKCSSDLYSSGRNKVSSLIFPPSLKKLTVTNCGISTGVMDEIGALPNLRMLKLRNCTYEDLKWEPTEGEFCSLQFLLLENLNMVNWVADETNFPRLKELVIRGCDALDEIPFGIGEIGALELIEVQNSSPSVAASARKIHEEQVELGNDSLRVLIVGSANQ